jgi:hypothetical protein
MSEPDRTPNKVIMPKLTSKQLKKTNGHSIIENPSLKRIGGRQAPETPALVEEKYQNLMNFEA